MSCSESYKLAERILELFFVRRDVYGIETGEGWRTVKEPVTAELIMRHLRGEACLGAHLIGKDGECRWIGWEVDNPSLLRPLFARVKEMFPSESMLIHTSGGRSFHVKVFFNRPIKSEDAHVLAKNAVSKLQGVEFYPKQPRISETGFGNFMRIPLGRHMRSGEFGVLVQPKSLFEIKPCPPPEWCVTPFKFVAEACSYRVKECRQEPRSGKIVETGNFCCTYYDGTVGYCREDLCPYFTEKTV